ncbi:MAG: YihY family inner membrane protein [Proteobacteria bacterium]|nr:YihY family inner membrane protein [Pseudomonadota bacterium]
MTESYIKRYFAYEKWPSWAKKYYHHTNIYFQDVQRSDLTKQASAMAYITLFSLVPSLAALFTLLGLFLPVLGSNAGLLDDARQFLFKYLATGSGTQVVSYLESFIAGLNLKKIGMSAFVGLLFTLVMLLRQIEDALNRIWLVTVARPMVTRFIYFWLFITLGMFGIAVVLGLSTSYSITTLITKKTLAVADHADSIPIISIAFSWLLNCLVFYLIYKVVPNCTVQNRSALRGAALAGTIFFILSKTYAVYVSKLSYQSVYGTLAALPIFLMWIYFCWVVVLAGALFAWRIQTGFPPIETEKSIEAATSPLEHLRNHSVKTRLPLIVLVLIHKKFLDGDRTGISTGDLVKALKLPHEWVFDAIELLKHQSLIVSANVQDAGGLTGSGGSERWFPTSNASSISVGSFLGQITSPLHDWIASWNPDLSPKIKQVLGEPERLKNDTTLESLLT